MGKQNLDNAIRNEYIKTIIDFFSDTMNIDALRTNASEIAIPVVDAEGTEKFVLIKVSVPRGSRNGRGGYEPYDGYAAAEEYRFDLENKKGEKKND